MIPFPILNSSNTNPAPWYNGDELIAFDSARVQLILDNFLSTDYNAKPIQVGNWTDGKPNVSTGYYPFQYGSGIKVPSTAYVYCTSPEPSWLYGSWCVDFWTKQETISSYNSVLNNLAYSPNAAPSSSYDRFIFGAFVNDVGIWNNVGAGGSYKIPAQYKTAWNSTEWIHMCIQYDSSTNTFYMYKDGVLIYNFVYVIKNVNLPNGSLFFGLSNVGNLAIPYVERYRLRTGIRFDLSGFDMSKIYLKEEKTK